MNTVRFGKLSASGRVMTCPDVSDTTAVPRATATCLLERLPVILVCWSRLFKILNGVEHRVTGSRVENGGEFFFTLGSDVVGE